MLAIIDGDVINYAAAFTAQSMHYEAHMADSGELVHSCQYKKDMKAYLTANDLSVNNGDVVISSPITLRDESVAIHNMRSMVASICAAVGATDSEVYLTGTGNFREKVATLKPYKGQRAAPKPHHYQAVRDWMVADGAIIVDGMEADDMMAIRQMECPSGSSTICTVDKDLYMVPGPHYNWKTQQYVDVSDDDAMRFFYVQLVEGDSIDNIPGAFHILGKRCTQELKQQAYDGGASFLLDLYKDHLAELDEIGKLLWMKRTRDDDWSVERLYAQ